MLQAMNSGHEGSLTTLHANAPRDALTRLETMLLMAGFDVPIKALRRQIQSAVNLIIQADRSVSWDELLRLGMLARKAGVREAYIATRPGYFSTNAAPML